MNEQLIASPWFAVMLGALVLLVVVLLIRTQRQVREIDRLRAAAAELLTAAQTCLDAEHERRKKLLPGAPATTYTQRRIAQIEAAIKRAKGGAT